MWIEAVAHLSGRKVCACVKWVSATSQLSSRVFNPHFGTFGQIRLSEKLNKCNFMSLHDYHVVCSIHTSEHSVNTRRNSAFRKIRPSDNFCFRTYAILHCLNQIRIFYYFLVKTSFHHNICHHQIHKKFFKISFLALSGIVIPAKMIVPCSSERRWIAEGARHRLSGRIVSME